MATQVLKHVNAHRVDAPPLSLCLSLSVSLSLWVSVSLFLSDSDSVLSSLLDPLLRLCLCLRVRLPV